MRPSDLIVVFFGCHTPFILRTGEKGTHRLIGETYVHGIMDGESVKQGVEETVFLLS